MSDNWEGGSKKSNAVVDDQKSNDLINRTRDFSSRFFTSSMRIDVQLNESIGDKLSEFSNIYKNITTLRSYPAYDRENLVENISDRIVEIIGSDARNGKKGGDCLLQIESPVGSYRNKFLQLIYLRLCEEWKFGRKFPFYINFANFEKEDNVDDTFNEMSDIIKVAKSLGVNNFVLILDCVREFSCGMEDIYENVATRITNIRRSMICDIVVGVDTNFAFGDHKKESIREIAFLGNTERMDHEKVFYKNRLVISSMQVNKVEECKDFIKACFNGIVLNHADKDVEECYKILNELQIMRIDAYWLKRLVENGRILEEENQDIISIYERIVFQGLTDDQKDEIASVAYNYEFLQDVSIVKSDSWAKIITHRSIMDFLIAYHFADLLKKMEVDQAFDNEAPPFLNMVFTNTINKFALPYINGNNSSCEKLLNIANNADKYQKLNPSGISQLAYWLGRIYIDDSQRKDVLSALLTYTYQKYYGIMDSSITFQKREIGDEVEKLLRNWLFAYRSVAVSNLLIGEHKFKSHKNGDERDIDYFKLLIKDKFLSDINSGFHLEYYGDVYPKIINGVYKLCLYDNRSKGHNTFRILAKELDKKMDYNLIQVSQLLTFCKLIQARKPSSRYNTSDPFDTRNSLEMCKKFIEKFEEEGLYKEVDIFVREYLKFMKTEVLEEVLEGETTLWSYIETKKFNELMRACTIERTGWLERRIPNPENIVEHMYNCWLIGFLFLPTTKKALIAELKQKPLLLPVGDNRSLESKYAGYDKNVILNMLLIHDLGETGSAGDASQRDKEKNNRIRNKSKKVEDEIMTSLFLHGTYPFINASFDEFYDCWDTWRTLDNSNTKGAHINAQIAKDIDNIQTAYQYCYFFNKYSRTKQEEREAQIRKSTNRNLRLRDSKMKNEQMFDENDLYVWLNRLSEDKTMSRIRTGIGKLICFMLIYKNPDFQEIVKKYNENSDIQNNTFMKWKFNQYDTKQL